MRLNKYLSEAGICSRREADRLIESGKITVDGKRAVPGMQVEPGQQVRVGKRLVEGKNEKVVLAVNKPTGIVCTEDMRVKNNIIRFLKYPVRITYAGRLDKDSEGLLIMTNDGELAYRVTHPKHELTKTYRARVSGVLSPQKLARLRKGVDIGGYVTRPARVEIVMQGERSAVVEITIHEGKNRQVRKMFAAVGNNVQELERIKIGRIMLGHTKPGHYRKLTKEEIEYLRGC